MNINKDNGCITLPEIGASIEPSLSRSEFPRTPAFAGAALCIQNEPWCSYSLPGIPQRDTGLAIMLQFRGEQLVSISLAHSAARFGSSWTDWSREHEIAREAFHDWWLAADVEAPPGKRQWGDIFSNCEVKCGGSLITIRYADSKA